MNFARVWFGCSFVLFLACIAMAGCGGSGNADGGSGGGNPAPPSNPGNPGNPAPMLDSISPSSTSSGSGDITLTLSGANLIPTSTAQWNGTALTTSYKNDSTVTAQIPASDLVNTGIVTVTVSNPSPGGGKSAGVPFTITPGVIPGEKVVSVAVHDLVWDPVNKVIYLSIVGDTNENPNTIQILDPVTGALGTAIPAGSEPSLLAVSAHSKYLYVSHEILHGASTVQRFTLPNLVPDMEIPLGQDSFGDYLWAMDLETAPNSDGTLALVREDPGGSPTEDGVVIYDNETPRPNVLCGWIQQGCSDGNLGGLYDSIQWNADGTEMFAANNETTGYDFYTIPVTSTGFGVITTYGSFVHGFGYDIHYDATTGDIYDDNGAVIDPSIGALVGTFDASGIMVPDGSVGKAFFLGQMPGDFGTYIYTLESFDIHKFTPIATLTLTVNGPPEHLIRWGKDGLAFTTQLGSSMSQDVYLIQGSFVDGSGSNLRSRPTQNVQRTWKAYKTTSHSPAELHF